jgi:hypothetical protein
VCVCVFFRWRARGGAGGGGGPPSRDEKSVKGVCAGNDGVSRVQMAERIELGCISLLKKTHSSVLAVSQYSQEYIYRLHPRSPFNSTSITYTVLYIIQCPCENWPPPSRPMSGTVPIPWRPKGRTVPVPCKGSIAAQSHAIPSPAKGMKIAGPKLSFFRAFCISDLDSGALEAFSHTNLLAV